MAASPSTAFVKQRGELKARASPICCTVDNPMVVPVNKTVRLIVTASDVIHAFAMPAFGIKIDAVPGRLNETWFKAEKEASITASARSCAARTTPSCRSPSASSREDQYKTWLAAAKTDRRRRQQGADGRRSTPQRQGRGRGELTPRRVETQGTERNMAGAAAHDDHDHKPYHGWVRWFIRPTTRTSARST